MILRLRELARERGWRLAEGPYGDGMLVDIDHGDEHARVVLLPNHQMLIVAAPPRLRAELLIWNATVAAFETHPLGRIERRG